MPTKIHNKRFNTTKKTVSQYKVEDILTNTPEPSDSHHWILLSWYGDIFWADRRIKVSRMWHRTFIGQGFASIERFSTMMNLPKPMTSKTYSNWSRLCLMQRTRLLRKRWWMLPMIYETDPLMRLSMLESLQTVLGSCGDIFL